MRVRDTGPGVVLLVDECGEDNWLEVTRPGPVVYEVHGYVGAAHAEHGGLSEGEAVDRAAGQSEGGAAAEVPGVPATSEARRGGRPVEGAGGGERHRGERVAVKRGVPGDSGPDRAAAEVTSAVEETRTDGNRGPGSRAQGPVAIDAALDTRQRKTQTATDHNLNPH